MMMYTGAGGDGAASESFFSRIMGCAQSEYSESQGGAHHRAIMGDGLRLVSSKLHFKPEQLDKLNDYFRQLARSDCQGKYTCIVIWFFIHKSCARSLSALRLIKWKYLSC